MTKLAVRISFQVGHEILQSYAGLEAFKNAEVG